MREFAHLNDDADLLERHKIYEDDPIKTDPKVLGLQFKTDPTIESLKADNKLLMPVFDKLKRDSSGFLTKEDYKLVRDFIESPTFH